MKQSNKGTYIFEGTVLEVMPNTLFKVEIPEMENKVVICYLSGKMRKNFIRIMPGDKVSVEFSPYDDQRGRIIYRFKPEKSYESKS
ncbi:MAG: translation initiation factor IF-1 [Patescibacteria group bacterium]|nr:MAG: translation initiation factor IF-1 [Patescibacteria group bacterium]